MSSKSIHLPNAQPPNIAGSSLIKEIAHLLQLTAPGARVVEQIAKLAGIGFHLHVVLHVSRIAIQHQHLVLRPASPAHGVHCVEC